MGKCKLNVGGGVTIGRYVWGKYDRKPNQKTTATLRFVSNSSNITKYSIDAVSPEVSFSDITNEDIVKFRIVETGEYVSFYYSLKVDGTGERVSSTTQHTSKFTWELDPNTEKLVVRWGISQDATINTINVDIPFTLYGYVISNNPDAYPHGGVKGDYYYKLLGSVPQATSYGITEALTMSIKDDAITEVQEEIKNGDV